MAEYHPMSIGDVRRSTRAPGRLNQATVPILTIVLSILFLLAILAQIFIPILARDIVDGYFGYPEYPNLQAMLVPYSALAIAAIFCGQLALIFVFRLLALVRAGEIFREPALRWVNGIIICCGIATFLALIAWIMQTATQVAYGGTFLLVSAAIMVGLAATLFMIVMRTLLLTAIDQRTELDEVI